ncbi:Uma2 family endonuclease [soil metagenome]
MLTAIPSKLWTVDEFELIDGFGVLDDARYELLEGEIKAKMGQNGPHLISVGLTTQALLKAFGEGFTVAQHSAYYLKPHNRPEPDIMIYKGGPRDYESEWVGPENVELVVEVADTRLDTAEEKIDLYARHGIREYWIVDIPRRELRIHRQPVSDESRWRQAFSLRENESMSIHGLTVLVADLLPRMSQKPVETP